MGCRQCLLLECSAVTKAIVQIDEVCEKTLTQLNPNNMESMHFTYIDIASVNAEKKEIDTPRLVAREEAPSRARRLVKSGDVIVSMTRPNLNAVAIISDQLDGAICSTGFCVLRAGPHLDSRYLYYHVQSKAFVERLTALTSGALYPAVTEKQVRSQSMLLPSLHEQRRIVDILDRAASIQKLRRQAEAKAHEIIPALFVDMFGDPEKNPQNLPMLPLGAVIERIETGKNLSAGAGLNDFKILKVSAVTSGQYKELERKPAPDDYTPPVEHIVKKDDFLFSRANTVELVGATTIVDDTDGRTLLPDKLWRITWRRGIAAEYMSALLQNQFVRATLGRLSSGTSASMRNISQSKLLAMKLPIAAQNEQAAFAEAAKCVTGVVRLSKQASSLSQSAAEALLGRELGSIESANHV